MYQYYLYLVIVLVTIVSYLCVTTTIVEWLRLHLHRQRQAVLINEDEALDLIDRFGYTLHEVPAPSPFNTNTTPILTVYNDSLGRAVLYKVRWMEVHHYYANQHWITMLDKVWPVTDDEPNSEV